MIKTVKHGNAELQMELVDVGDTPRDPRDVIREALTHIRPDTILRTTIITPKKIFGPFWDQEAIKWLGNNMEIIDEAREMVGFAMACEEVPVQMEDDKFKATTRMN